MEIVLISSQDSYTDWDEHTMGSEIILGKMMELLGDVVEMEAHFGLF
jgi:hypothetical protein